MIDSERVCAGVRKKIAAHNRRKKYAVRAAVASLAACLCGGAALGAAQLLAPALPIHGAAAAEEVNEAGEVLNITAELCGGSYTLAAAVQDEESVYILLQTTAGEQQLSGVSFNIRQSANTAAPSAYLPSNCGVLYYQAADEAAPAALLLRCPKAADAESYTLVLCAHDEKGSLQSARLAFTLSATAAAETRRVDAAIAVGEEELHITSATLTPFGALLYTDAPAAPLNAQTLERYSLTASVTAGGESIAAGRTQLSYTDSGAALAIYWQAQLSPKEITAITINNQDIPL